MKAPGSHSGSTGHLHQQFSYQPSQYQTYNVNSGQSHANETPPDSDSGLEVVEEPTLRPSDLVRGNHNRSMSIISGECICWGVKEVG